MDTVNEITSSASVTGSTNKSQTKKFKAYDGSLFNNVFYTSEKSKQTAEKLYTDITAKTKFGLPTTGADIGKHIKEITPENVYFVLQSYVEKSGGESLITAICGEVGLSAEERAQYLTHIKNQIVKNAKNRGTNVNDLNKELDGLIRHEKNKIGFMNGDKINVCIDKIFARNTGVNLSFRNTNSVIKNKYHKGDPYSVVQKGFEMTITNKKTQKARTVDLNKLLSKYSIADRFILIEQLQKLPGEVLMDIAIEADEFTPAKHEGIDVGNVEISVGKVKSSFTTAAGAYYGWSDALHIKAGSPGPFTGFVEFTKRDTFTLVHELGHSVDYTGIINNSTIDNDKNFKKIFEAEMKNYIKLTGNKTNNRENYCLTSNDEMFADCYALLMTGDAPSKEVIEKYFPQSLKYIEKTITAIRNKSDTIRHH